MDVKELWTAVLAELQLNLSETQYKTWLKNTRAQNLTENSIEIVCEYGHTKVQLEKKFHSMIQDSVNKIGKGEYEIIYKVGRVFDKKDSEELGPLFQPEVGEGNQDLAFYSKSARAGLSPHMTFDNYVMASNNRLAHAIATAVTGNPGKLYNPFFMYSGVGLGKTHLLHAIGNEIIKKHPNLKIAYATGETFGNELIEAIRSGSRGGPKGTEWFRKKYRTVDVFLMDDIQFIAGKASTQEEFFHTYNALHMAQKQIVIASDRPPKDFDNLEERITSRLSSGIISDISRPDVDTRIAILRTKRELAGHTVPDETIDFIAQKIDTNIRELEGAYLQVLSYAQTHKKPPNLQTAKESLSGNIIKEKTQRTVNLNDILKTVANYYSVRVTDIKGKRRTKEVVIPRQVAMYLMYDLTETPYMSIGELMGGRDHTTIMHGVSKVESTISSQAKTRQDVENIKRMLVD